MGVGPCSSADRAEDFPTTGPVPIPHYLKAREVEVAGRAIGCDHISTNFSSARRELSVVCAPREDFPWGYLGGTIVPGRHI